MYSGNSHQREILISPPWWVAGMICTSTHLGTLPEAYRWTSIYQEALHPPWWRDQFFEINISWVGAGEGGSKRDVFVQRVTLRAYQSSQLVTVASPMTPHAVLVLGTSRPSQWPPRPTDFSHLWWLKVPIGLETQRRGRGRSVEPISSRPYSGVWHAHMDHGR
jgi:hypothetical protein